MNQKPCKSIIIRYIDTHLNEDIVLPTIEENLSIGTYTYNSLDLLRYNLLSDSSKDITVTDDSNNIELLFEYEYVLGKVSIKYIDKSNGDEIEPTCIYDNLDLNTYTFNSKYIPDYKSIEPLSYVVTLDKYNQEQEVKFYYFENTGSITLKYIDSLTRENLDTPTVIDDISYGDYNHIAKEIPGYCVVGCSVKSITLNETLSNCELYFEYRPLDYN